MRLICLALSAVLFVATIAWPALALMMASITQGATPQDGFLYSHNQVVLLARTGLMALAAAMVCLIVSLGVIVFFPRRLGPLQIAVLAAGLLCPPMVYAFGWLRVFPASLDAHLRCVATWVLWAWPIAALALGAGWTRVGRSGYQAALLDTSGWHAGWHVAMPALAPVIIVAGSILFILFFSDYGVPHAFGLRVYSTELLSWATQSPNTIDAAWPALLPAAITACALALLFRFTGKLPEAQPDSSMTHGSAGARFMWLTVCSLGWLVPLIALAKPLTGAIVIEAFRTYSDDLMYSMSVSLAGAAIVLLVGLGAVWAGRPYRPLLFLALLLGSLPGALMGQALIAAYNRPQVSWIYDNWPIVALAYAGRYAWIGLLAAGVMARFLRSQTAEQARLDGASETSLAFRIVLPEHGPLLLAVAAIVVALSMGDVAASTLVRVPDFHPIAHVIIEKFHRFEDGMLISLSLMLVGIAAACAGITAWVFKRTARGSAPA